MRINHPVTEHEHDFPADVTLMSTTDVQSHIQYCNAAFISVSGYEQDELVGQPHNLVRHPDMPAEAFADMWATLKGGESWTALVKNRRKNGDHYWVRANAAPMRRAGRVVGYLSVRTKPGRQEVEAAEAFYRQLREGRAGSLKFHKGLVVRGGWSAFLSWQKTLSLSWRVRGLLLLGWLAQSLAVYLIGLGDSQWLAITVGGLIFNVFLAISIEGQTVNPLRRVLDQALNVAEAPRVLRRPVGLSQTGAA